MGFLFNRARGRRGRSRSTRTTEEMALGPFFVWRVRTRDHGRGTDGPSGPTKSD